MRIRSTKPEFWRSKLIASVSWDARFVLKALESYVDDNGVGEDDVNVLVGDCFLHDLIREPSRTLARVSEAISELHQAGLVWRYASEGRNLLYVSFWETVQRIDKAQSGRNPRPDGTLNYKESVIRECVANVREPSRGVAPGTGEQGNRGTEEQRNSSSSEVATATLRPDVSQLLDLLDSKLSENNVKLPKRNKANESAARLLIDNDGYTFEQVAYLINWSQKDSFWRANIHSMSKLRDKADTLRLQSQREAEKNQPQASRADEAQDFLQRLEEIDAANGGGEVAGDYPQLR